MNRDKEHKANTIPPNSLGAAIWPVLGIVMLCVGAGFTLRMAQTIGVMPTLKVYLPAALMFVGFYLAFLRRR